MTFENRVRSLQQRFSSAYREPPNVFFAVQITLTDAEGGTLYIANTKNGFEIAPYDYHDHTVAIRISGADLVRILGGGMSVDGAIRSGKLQIFGEMEHMRLLRKIADPPRRRVMREN